MDPRIAVCPYNSNHILAKHKIIPHIKKCRDALRDERKIIHCKNDLSIIFLENDKEYHFSNCNFCHPYSNDLQESISSASLMKLKRLDETFDEVKDKEWVLNITEPEIDLNNSTNFTQSNLMSSVPVSHTNPSNPPYLDGSIWLDQSLLQEMEKPSKNSNNEKEESLFY